MEKFSKEKYCKELEDFINYTEKYLKETCVQLNWNFHNINKNDYSHITCPFNKAHRVPEKTIENHLEKCEWNTLGYTRDCIPFSESSLLSDDPSSIKFDIQLQHKILQTAKQKDPELNIGIDEKLIPQTSDRFMSDFTTDERKILYEYVVSNTIAPNIGQDITNINKPEKTNKQCIPIIELLAQERNLKRRRAKHRGVHTNKKSHTEILRELVQQQMEMFKEHVSKQFGNSNCENTEKSNFYSNNDEVENKEKKNKITNEKVSEYSISNQSEKDFIENSKLSYYKNEFDLKNLNTKFKKNVRLNRDHNSIYKYSSYYKNYDYRSSLKDRDSQNSSMRHNHSNNNDKYEDCSIEDFQSEIQYRKQKKKDFYNKNYNSMDTHHYRHHRSKSNENKHNKKSQCNFQEQRHQRKSVKHDKKEGESFIRIKDQRKYQSSSYKYIKSTENKTQV